jgi:hypothetical protein
VRGVAGWFPAIGDTVEIVRWGSRTGDFSSVTGLSLGAGQPLEANLTTDALVLAGRRRCGAGEPAADVRDHLADRRRDDHRGRRDRARRAAGQIRRTAR